MSRLRVAVLALAALFPMGSLAAEVTRIASSFEDARPFQMFFDLDAQRTSRRMTIAHEFHQNGDVQTVPELQYLRTDSRLNFDVRVGIWKDLELHYRLPIVFQFVERWNYASGRDDTNSTVGPNANNCINADGTLFDPNCPTTGAGSRAMFAVPNSVGHTGLGNMVFGLAYAIFDQRKDDTKPMWLVGLDYEAPTADLLDPSAVVPPKGKIGDRIHKLKFYTALSRDLGGADPYFKAYYQLPSRGSGWYSNCDNPSAGDMSHPENCNTNAWSRSDTGIQYPIQGGLFFGSELAPVHEGDTRVAFDFRAIADYVGPGRYYNELSYLFHKLMSTGDYLELGGSIGLITHASYFFHAQLLATLLYDTAHALSNEQLSKDPTNPSPSPGQINPNFDYRADAVSRRFIASSTYVFRLDLDLSFNF